MRNRKGFTIPELLVAMLLISIIAVIITHLIGVTMKTSTVFSRYNTQQFTAHSAFARLNQDIEAAVWVSVRDEDLIEENKFSRIYLDFSNNACVWTLENGKLYLDAEEVVDSLTDESTFIYGSDCLTIILMPEPTNYGANSMNVPKPLVSQYSLTYKKGNTLLSPPY